MKYLCLVLWVTVTLIGGGHSEAWEVYRDCGGVLPISLFHQTIIEYKYGQMYSPVEFCVWTLLPQANIQSVRLQITQTMNQIYNPDGIVAYFWNSTGLHGVKLPGNNTDITFEIPPSFLAFSSSGADESNGFRIVIISTGGQGPTIGRAYHIEKNEGEFVYPDGSSSTQKYRNNDRVSILLMREPSGSVKVAKMKELKLKIVDLEAGFDYVAVYELGGYWYDEVCWLLGNATGTDELDFSVNFFHPTVFLFTSDSKTTGKGFTIQWKDFPYKVKF